MPYSSTANNQIILYRNAGNVTLSWAGNSAGTPFTMTGISTAPVEMISLDFARFRYDSGSAKLGSLSVDRVLVEIPEPSALAL